MNHTQLKRVSSFNNSDAVLFIIDEDTKISSGKFAKESGLSKQSLDFIQKKRKLKQTFISFTEGTKQFFVAANKSKKEDYKDKEAFRKIGATACNTANSNKLSDISIQSFSSFPNAELLAAEGASLANYQFLKYKAKPKDHSNSLQKVNLLTADTDKTAVEHVQNIVNAVCYSRTLVNEPLNFLTAEQLSKETQKLGKEAGFKVTVFNKKRIEKENMQGILAVNLGSPDPPTFNILEWKPKNAKNKKPIVLVGKGVVFDTGGLSLKPTTNSMDFMKCDMSGAASVVGILYAIAKNKLPMHVIGLIPATDNRPGQNAYVPGDIIKMRDGLRVEVLNTDAEGRMIMADALSYAKKYDPELVIDFATLTGAAMRSIGPFGTALMSKADRKVTNKLIDSGFATYERLIEFPLWEEYGNMVKSDIADIKNSAGPLSGAITAGKFLENFTDYPWIHLDIAATAWNFKHDAYRLKNGTGVGVRLIVDFLKNFG